MRYILLIVAIFLVMPTPAAMLDADGKPRIEPFSVNAVTQQCEIRGWFVVYGTVYMCTKIRENVPTDEIRNYIHQDFKLQEKKRKERANWYKEWIKTDEGKVWKKKYDRKLLLDNAKP